MEYLRCVADQTQIKRFDLVRLLTIKNVKYVSGPAGRAASPQGVWSVIGNVGVMIFLAKEDTVIEIPIIDIVKIADYSVERVLNNVKQVKSIEDLKKFGIGGPNHGKARKEGKPPSEDNRRDSQE